MDQAGYAPFPTDLQGDDKTLKAEDREQNQAAAVLNPLSLTVEAAAARIPLRKNFGASAGGKYLARVPNVAGLMNPPSPTRHNHIGLAGTPLLFTEGARDL